MLCQPQSACGVHSVSIVRRWPHAIEHFTAGLLAVSMLVVARSDCALGVRAGAGGVPGGAGADGHAGGGRRGGGAVWRLWRRHDPLSERGLHPLQAVHPCYDKAVSWTKFSCHQIRGGMPERPHQQIAVHISHNMSLEAVVLAHQAATPRRRPDGPFAELLPWAGEQVADWEAAASAGVQLPDVSPCGFYSTCMAAWRSMSLPNLCAAVTPYRLVAHVHKQRFFGNLASAGCVTMTW